MPKIAVYVQKNYDRKAYKVESFAIRGFAGVAIIQDVLERAGHEVGFCSLATVSEYDIVLVSITSSRDWYSFIEERVRWQGFAGKVIVGGAGVMNIRPVLFAADAFVFGRGEDLILPVVEAYTSDRELDTTSVALTETFSVESRYAMRQGKCYPHEIKVKGQEWVESGMGCNHKCAFCAYTWHRRLVAQEVFGSYFTEGSSHDEAAILDLLKLPPEEWNLSGAALLVGLDGTSERLRRMASKPISDEGFVRFMLQVVNRPKSSLFRIFNILGYPTETEEDWDCLYEVLRRVDEGADDGDPWYINLHSTPLKALPATPAAGWPMANKDYRGVLARRFASGRTFKNRWTFMQGRRLQVNETFSTESLASTLLEALILRGEERDQDLVRKLSQTPTFWSANAERKLATLEKYADVDRLLAAYTYSTLPSRYLDGVIPLSRMMQIGEHLLAKYGGEKTASGQTRAE